MLDLYTQINHKFEPDLELKHKSGLALLTEALILGLIYRECKVL